MTSCNILLITDDISPSEQPDGKQTPNERPPNKIKKLSTHWSDAHELTNFAEESWRRPGMRKFK